MSEHIRYNLERSKVQQINMFVNLIEKYETYLKINNEYSINQLTVLLQDYSDKNPQWLPSLFEVTIDLDIQLTYCTSALNFLSEQVFPELVNSALGFNRDKLVKVFLLKSRLSTDKAVPVDTILSVGNRAETCLKKDSIDYRFLRLFCITNVIGLLNSACLLSMFGYLQFQLYNYGITE